MDPLLQCTRDEWKHANEQVLRLEAELSGWRSRRWEAERSMVQTARHLGMKPGATIDDLDYSIKLKDQWTAKYDPKSWGAILSWSGANCPDAIQRSLNISKINDHIRSGGRLPNGLDVEAFVSLSIRRKTVRNVPCQTDEKTPW